ncbi:OmpP1/FadL family transporter [Sulfuricystis thermophila]|uniref:OmpP1/FadL family transporter n=1 Tax=Sulfuricystis thermophila TaxID=2496847 RepID=UPI00103568D1|nr:outer membrane protein transport protein [Sulfuricystis thermophila]
MKLKKIAALLAIAGLSAPAFATNGDNLIGLGAMSRALGGTGTAAFFGAENTLTNPALLGKMKGTEFSIAGTAFMPDVKASTDIAMPGTVASKTSDADFFAIPEVSLANRLNNNWTFGLGMYGTSGMGVDYRGNDGLFHAYSNLQMMKFVPSVAYNNGNFGLGAALAIQYGALDLNYKTPSGTVGNGNSSDFGYGVNLGAYYDVTKDFTVGVTYQSEIAMTYKDQLTTAADGFGIGPNGMGTVTSNKLTQPEEIKLGVAYTTGPWLLTADYKRVNWSKADGYKTFNWDDQDIFGLGVKYSGNGWWLGAGYNYGKDPIKKLPDAQSMTGYSNQAINMFNNMFFPAIVENHFTFGGGMNIGKNSSLDFAVVYASEVSKTINTGTITSVMATMPTPNPALMPVNATTQKTDHSQTAVTVSVRMNF